MTHLKFSRRAFVRVGGLSLGIGATAVLAACAAPTAVPPTAAPAKAATEPTKPVAAPATEPTKPAAAPVTAPTAASGSTPAAAVVKPGTTPVDLQFFFPVAVGGPITRIVEGYADAFSKANGDVKVTAVFGGSYQDTLTKIQTAIDSGGQPPDAAVLLSTDMNTLIDADSIVPFDDLLKTAPAGYAEDFYPAFMLNSKFKGSTWGIPFQRSTPVLYFNKDHFKEVGLPDTAPKNWAEQVSAGKKLTKEGGARWGIQIPSDGFPYWLFQGIVLGNGVNVVGDTANKVTFNMPPVVEALQAMVDLSKKDKIMSEAIIQWATTPTDFTGGKASMMWHTTGSLTNVLKEAKFPVGVGFLPGLKQNGAPTGGGNLYLFKKTTDAKRAAAWRLVQFLSSPEQAAQWSIDTGYVAPRKAAYDTPALKAHAEKTPQALVARDQLQAAGKELSGHNGPKLQEILGLAVQSAITGKKDPKTALDDAQRDAEKTLAPFKD